MQRLNRVALSLLTCAATGLNAQQPIIGLITKTETNPFFVSMTEGAARAARAQGAKLISGAGRFDGDNAGQITQLENMIAAGAKTILITPSDSKAIVPAIRKARAAGVMVIALDSPADPQDATDALFGTDNYQAGVLIGRYAKAAFRGRTAVIATLDLLPGQPVGAQRHNGFLAGFGVASLAAKSNQLAKAAAVVCMHDTYGDQAKGQAVMENCLQRYPGINLVYTVNEPTAAGAYHALKAVGREKAVMIVSFDGGCGGVTNVKAGMIAATAQQYPVKMATLGVDAGVAFARSGKKATGYINTGVTLITDKPMRGVESRDTRFGLQSCWGNTRSTR